MFGIGTPELLVILVVALVVLGPKRLPEVARALGKGLAELRKATSGVAAELERARWMLEEEVRTAERGKPTVPPAEATVDRGSSTSAASPKSELPQDRLDNAKGSEAVPD